MSTLALTASHKAKAPPITYRIRIISIKETGLKNINML